jgi:hypothetical protein
MSFGPTVSRCALEAIGQILRHELCLAADTAQYQNRGLDLVGASRARTVTSE